MWLSDTCDCSTESTAVDHPCGGSEIPRRWGVKLSVFGLRGGFQRILKHRESTAKGVILTKMVVRGVNFEIILPVFAYFLWFVQLQMHIWRFNRNSCNYRFIYQWKSLVVQKQCWKSWKIRTKSHLLIILCGGKMFQKVVKSTLLHRWRCKIDEYRGGGGIHRVYTTAVP